MPIYKFSCKGCECVYEEMTAYDPKGRYAGVACPGCGSKRKSKVPSVCTVTFADPTTTSKFDSFDYRAGYNMNKAQDERRAAEAKSHMGGTGEFYRPIDDFQDDKLFGEIK